MSISKDEEGELLKQVLTARGGSQPVIDSYNYFVRHQIPKILAKDIIPITAQQDFYATFENPFFVRPKVNDLQSGGTQRNLYPFKARMNGLTYSSALWVEIKIYRKITETKIVRVTKDETKTITETRIISVSTPGEPVYAKIGDIPVMLHSELDNLHDMTPSQRRKQGESEVDPGGYFIIKGVEKVLLNIEKLRTLSPYLYENKKGKYTVRYTSQTLTDSTIVMVLEDNEIINVTFTRIGITNNSINIFYIFYILGLRENLIPKAIEMMESFIVDRDPQREMRRKKSFHQYIQTTIVGFEAQTGYQHERIMEILATKFKDTEIHNDPRRYELIEEAVQTDLFKNIPLGSTIEERVSGVTGKMRMLASMVVKYIDFENGYLEPDDRDSWANKRIVDAGEHMTVRFTKLWTKMVGDIRKEVVNRNITQPQEIKNVIRYTYMTEQFISSFTRGLWGSQGTGREVVVVDTLKRDNILAAKAHIRRVSTPTNRQAKIRDKRLIHNTQWGALCPTMTPEGENCLEVSTLIRMKDGSEKPIGELKDGDEIITVNPRTLEESTTKIYNHFVKSSKEYGKSIFRIITMRISKSLKEREIVCTADHPFLTQEGWVYASDLKIDKHKLMVYFEGLEIPGYIPIKSIVPDEDCMISDFTTEAETHSMISNGFVTHNCGLVKDSALTIYISVDRDDAVIKSTINNMYRIDPEIGFRNSIFLNGVHLGYGNTHEIYNYLLGLRRKNLIYFDIGLVLNIQDELWIMTNSGRVCRPLLIVDSETNRLVIDRDHLRGQPLKVLLSSGAMEYIDIAEQQQPNILIAWGTEKLRERIERLETTKQNYLEAQADLDTKLEDYKIAEKNFRDAQNAAPYTHAEIDPTVILGISASIIPLPEFMPNPRGAYQAAMAKQALGPNSSRVELRYDTTVKILNDPNVPFFSTDAHEWLGLDEYPSGRSVFIAIAAEKFTEEDAIVFNKTSLERGMFSLTIFHSYKETLCQTTNQYEYPGIPDVPEKQRYRYAKLDPETSIVQIGAYVEPDDCLIGKLIRDNLTGKITDSSLYVEIGKRGIVEDVFISENDKNCKLIKIRIRESRTPQTGDKFASRYAQKGIIGQVIPEEEMPQIISENPILNGVRPHIIFNPNGIPSRMTVGKLIEMFVGRKSLLTGERISATAFRKFNYENLVDELENLGFSRSGKERMINGVTGREMDVEIFVGPVYYQLLRHLVEDKIQARGTGRVLLLTRQPASGIRSGGGLKIGKLLPMWMIKHLQVLVVEGDTAKLRESLIVLNLKQKMKIPSLLK